MKVLLINGSPHKDGCTFTSLSEVAGALQDNGIETEIFWIGSQAVQGCTACFRCKSARGGGCIFQDRLYLELVKRIQTADGIIIGSPVYYAGPAGSLCAILDRIFFSAAQYLLHKPGACVVNCRRGGASAAFDRLNKYFTILQMPVVASQYWNSTHGCNPAEVKRDLEGLQTMRTLGKNMAHMLKSTAQAGLPLPSSEPLVATNFIS
ncbi:MAG: flavodoxin family protein [Oligosphaeraceae bacterium]|nr:flavodoxin family protein [Oligosphaeraceae bacterium]